MEHTTKSEGFSIVHHVEWAALMITIIGGMYLMDGKIERQGTRTDKLYEMWCETQKEIKDIYIHLQKNS